MRNKSCNRWESNRRFLCLLLCLLMLSTMIPAIPIAAAADYGDLTVEQPVLVVSGDALIAGGVYTADNVSQEKSYTMDELQASDGVTATRFFSAINSAGTRRIYYSEGVDVAALLALSGYTGAGEITAFSGTFSRTVDLSVPRYYFPGIADGNTSGGTEAAAMLAWKSAVTTAPAIPDAASMVTQSLQLQVGQINVTDINNGLYVNSTDMIQAGGPITGAHINVLGTAYTRAEMLSMPRAEREYSGNTVRGVPLAHMLRDLSDDTAIEFQTYDDWSGISAYHMTKGELEAKNAILAYETKLSGTWTGYVRLNSGTVEAYFRLWIDGVGGAHGVTGVSVKPAAASAYKHISYTDAPYNIDAITGATLTVEGPGVVNSVPITVRQLEEASNSNIHRGTYTDLRDGVGAERMYEGVKVLSILDGLVNPNVIPLDDEVEVVFKNRWRQEVSRLSYGEIKDAAQPVILAYGTALTNESPVAPFVFNLAAGIVPGLGNDDGPLKLVYDQAAPPIAQFSSVAYMYVEEGAPPPGFKHITATDEAYNNVANTEYILTFIGDDLGREVNYTVRELEEMAGDKPSLSHRDEYSLSNTTYWYVNEYEGIKLWDLLVDIGVDAAKADKGTGLDDNTPLVSFSSWDNYQISSQFSFYQLAHPELFYFYEKSPLDLGVDRPTKEQLATADYQPDNQVGDWGRDSNNYPVKAGYPVLLAYGVNSYPYVRNPGMDGFRSGLGNSGGPMRLIYGKTDGLNRANPSAEENYAYFFNNGSQQLQRVQEIYVGNATRYSTHMENPNPAYQAMKSQEALSVEIVAGGSSQTVAFTLSELESILYGPGVAKRDRDNEGRQEKGYYYYRDAGGAPIEDLFEGVNLEYLLVEHIGLQGLLGTVEMYSGNTLAATYDLSGIGAGGQNSLRGTGGLGMTVAFAKNGYPLVAGSNNSSNSSPGYVHDDLSTGKAIRNGGGPLLFVRGQTAAESTAQSIVTGVENKTYVDNLTKIVVNLDPDPYAHVGSEYEALAARQVRFSGAVAQTGGVSITVGALETKQRYIVDGEYTIGGNTGFYRGLDLYALLYDRDIGASALMNEIIIKNEAGDSKALSYEELTGSGKKAILAYGSGAGDNAKPLGLADGGPMRLIVDGGTGADCITNVSEIVVSAASITAWKHNFGVFTQYADHKLEISGQNLVHNKTYTVAMLESMDNIIVQDSYKVGSNTVVVQGVELYKLLQNIGFAQGMDSSVFSVYASDGYSPGTFTASQLKDGINGKPILVAFGQGTTTSNGLPLVPYDNSPGYDATADNQSGPLRLMIHDNSGWSVKFLMRIVVGQAGGNPDPSLQTDFTLYPGGAGGMPQASVRAVVTDSSGGIWAGSNGAGAAYISPEGVITSFTAPVLKTNFVTGVDIAPDGSVWLSQGGSVGSQNAPPSAHYGFARYKDGQFTYYDRSSVNSSLPNDCVYGIDVDKDGNVWVTTHYTLFGGGMEGGLTKFNPSTNAWRTWKMGDRIPTVSAWAVKADDKGGAWVTTYRTSSIDLLWPDESYAYISAAGAVTPYAIPAGNDFNWSRSISIAPGGGVYITRMSGAHDPTNDGGWLDYIFPDGSVKSYKGDDLIPELKAKARLGFYPEIRTVFVDAGGDLWLSTNGLGVYRCLVSGGNISIIENFSSMSGSWPAGALDDVWSIYVSPDGKACFGSNGGVAWAEVTLKDSPAEHVGDATAETAQLRITGAVEKPGYFTTEGLKTYPGVTAQTKEYSWQNDYGSTGVDIMTGVYLEDLLNNVMRLSGKAVSVTVKASDGFSTTLNLDDNELGVNWTDSNGNKPMLAWRGTSGSTNRNIIDFGLPRLIVGQIGQGHVNRPLWVSNVMSITVNASEQPPTKQPQGAPIGMLTGVRPTSASGRGRINGTTAAMEYSDNQVNWFVCSNAYTEVYPGQYYVRYSETETHNASAAITVSVTAAQNTWTPPPVTGDVVLSIYNGSTKVKDFTQSNINALNHVTNNYSSYNTFPTYSSYTDVKGVTISTLLSEAGANPSENTEITFYSSDGFYATLRAGDLTAARYYFGSNGNRGAQVPAIIAYDSDGSRLYFGQLSAQEQTSQAFVKDVDRIVIGGTAGRWGMPTASPASGSIIKAGSPIRLSLPSGSGEAKIYYTLDGSTPTVESKMYNVTAERWFAQKGMSEHPPIVAPSNGELTIMAIIIGLGKDDGSVVTFHYKIATGGSEPGGDDTVIIDSEQVPFSDVSMSDWFHDSVRFVYERGLMKGTATDEFSPNLTMSRAMVVTILHRLAGSPSISWLVNPFGDIHADLWYTDAVIWAAANGIVNGYGNGKFGPNDSITREQMAAILHRYARLIDYDVSLKGNAGLAPFTDANNISPYATEAMLWACNAGILQGSDNKLDPRGNATRAQAAAVLERFIKGTENE